MRYLTKQWYQTMQDSGLGVCLEVDERAAEFSEDIYQTLRTQKLAQWLRDREEVCQVLGESFDPMGEERSFDEFCARELETYRTRTPEPILTKVADLRLLAVGYCTREVFRDLKHYAQQCREQTEQTMDRAWEEIKAQGLDEAFTGEHSLHDSVILTMEREGEDLVIEFERDEVEWPEIKAVRFRGAVILTQEQDVENAWWLYDEIWRNGEGYEVHALLWRDDGVFELTVQCRDTEVLWTMEPK